MIKNYLSFRKSKRAFRGFHRLYRRKEKILDSYAKESIQSYLKLLQAAILKKDAKEAKQLTKQLDAASLKFMPRTLFDKTRDFVTGILFALFIAVLIRTMWFELYTIPTGSMRPTLKEEDYLIVSKTDFGINVPLQEAHFYFDPDLVQRESIIVFNSAHMDMDDADTTYFYLFPGKKQLVKRLIAKPGDTVYFYGGDVYGIDRAGQPFKQTGIEHIPFIRFDGKVETPNAPQKGLFHLAVFHQMNQPVAKLAVTPFGTVTGEMIGAKKDHYFDLWGMKHYAMARLLTKEQLKKIHPGQTLTEDSLLYLELTHHPSIQGAQIIRDEYNRLRPEVGTSVSLIPLQSSHLDAISQHMTTCRFTVKNGIASRFGWNAKGYDSYLPKLSNVPDGTYEIQDGKVYELPFPRVPILGVFTNGYTKLLPKSHPLYSQDPEMIQKLYNLGFEFLNQYAPVVKNQRATPSRYAYFKEGDLYSMGGCILKKEDPALKEFIKTELEKKSISTTLHPYHPFVDQGEPTTAEIMKNGIQIPDKMYLGLGDNHAMSADSRQFGFIPEDNLKGGVSFIFAPIGSRFGQPPQPAQNHFTFPNLTVWAAFFIIALATSTYYRKKLREHLTFPK